MCLFPGYFFSIFGKARTVHAQCCVVVVVVVIVVLTDITIDVYNYRLLKRVFKKKQCKNNNQEKNRSHVFIPV